MEDVLSIATWNLAGINNSWCEFRCPEMETLCDAIDEMLDGPTSILHTTKLFDVFSKKKIGVFRSIMFYITTGKASDPRHWTYCCIEKGFDEWMDVYKNSTIADFLDVGKDPYRRFSWGDRHLSGRPTPISSNEQDLTMFQRDLHSNDDMTTMMKFAGSWVKYAFTTNEEGTLIREIPRNKYCDVEDPFVEIFTYIDLFVYDTTITWILNTANIVMNKRRTDSPTLQPITWQYIRATIIHQMQLETRFLKISNIINRLHTVNEIVAVQELCPEQFDEFSHGQSNKLWILPEVHSKQMAALCISDASRRRVLSGNVFEDQFPAPTSELFRSRVCGVVIQGPTIREKWMYVSVHTYPRFTSSILEKSIEVGKVHNVTKIFVLGDWNTKRKDIPKFYKDARDFGFEVLWKSDPQDTVQKERTRLLQPQLAKGGIQDTSPKDHILVYSVKAQSPKVLTEESFMCQTGVLVSEEFERADPDDLQIKLPSDHAIVIATFPHICVETFPQPSIRRPRSKSA